VTGWCQHGNGTSVSVQSDLEGNIIFWEVIISIIVREKIMFARKTSSYEHVSNSERLPR